VSDGAATAQATAPGNDPNADFISAADARGPWGMAWHTLKQDRLALVCLAVVGIYLVLGVLAEFGVIAKDANTLMRGLEYEDASWSAAWAHFGWFGQTCLTTGLVLLFAVPLLFLRLGPKQRFLLAAAVVAGGTLLIAGIIHAVAGPEHTPGHDHSFTRHLLGGDIFGRNIFSRTLHGIAIAFKIGVMVTLMAVPVGVTLGAMAGYFGGLIDELIVWFYTTLASIPGILLILAVGFALKQRELPDIYVIYFALGTTTWITLCRLIRGEVLKHKGRDYVTAARALGAGNARLLARHILPNVVHIVIIRFSLQFIFAVQTEVILSYLGVGISDSPSWGRMIDDSKQELINGEYMNITGATIALFGLALAFNVLGDALRDALDPRLKE
jgi:peptide/nickel transport system permease protein